MSANRDDSQLPDDAVWADSGTNPVADENWLARFQHTSRHYRLYDSYGRRFKTGHPDNRILFGVVLIDADSIAESQTGILHPSPSMIGHLNSLPSDESAPKPRDSQSPLNSFSSVGGSKDAFRFGSDVGFHLDGIRIRQNIMQWRSVRALPPIEHCEHCDGILASPLAKQCLKCGADWH